MVYNSDLFRKREPEILEWMEAHDFFINPLELMKFCVESQLAPYIVEEPFFSMWLDIVDKTKDSKQMLLPRGHAKSFTAKAVAAFVFCAPQHHVWGKQVRLPFVGISEKWATRSVRATKKVLESNPYVLKTYGQQRPTKAQVKQRVEFLLSDGIDPESVSPPEWTPTAFRTANHLEGELETGIIMEEPSCWAQGMEEAKTGYHGNFYFMDDPVGETSAKSVTLKERARNTLYELVSQRNPDSLFLDIGTRHAPDDLHHTIQTEYYEEYSIHVYTCWGNGPQLEKHDFVRDRKRNMFVLKNRKLEEVDVLWHGFGQIEEDIRRGFPLPPLERKEMALHHLAKKMHNMPPKKFANQYLNSALASEEQLFTPDMFRAYDPGRVPLCRHYVLTDSATGTDNRSSYRVVATVGIDANDVAYVRELDFGRWSPEEYVDHILNHVRRYAPDRVLMEKVSWQGSFKTNMELKCRLTGQKLPRVHDVEGRTVVGKLERMEALQPRFANGRIYFNPKLRAKTCADKNAWAEMVEQFGRVHEVEFVKGLHLDIPDALSDIDHIDREGNRICRPAKRRVTQTYPQRSDAIMEPLRQARERGRRSAARGNHGGDLWRKPAPGGKKGLWD